MAFPTQTCGYSVPFYEFKAHRTHLLEWAAKKEGADRDTELTVGYSSATQPRTQTGMKRWWEERNTTSLDGLPGMVTAHLSNEIFRSTPIDKKSSYETASGIQITTFGVTDWKLLFDFKLLTAFLTGVLLTLLYGRLSLAAHAISIIN